MISLQTYIDNNQHLQVQDASPIVIAPGRYNPPHRGHRLLVSKLIKLGEKLDAEPVLLVIDSGKRNKSNPLSGEVRKEYLCKMFPDVNITIAKNPYEAVYELYTNHHKYPIGGVTGSDRADSYKKMIGRIFGPVLENQFFAEILHRDPDADDISGISATGVRQAALCEDEARVRGLTGLNHKDAIQLIEQIKQGSEE